MRYQGCLVFDLSILSFEVILSTPATPQFGHVGSAIFSLLNSVRSGQALIHFVCGQRAGRFANDFCRDAGDSRVSWDIFEHNTSGRFGGRVHTRFPPEPNAYLHIGHAKASILNYTIAQELGGKFNLRFATC